MVAIVIIACLALAVGILLGVLYAKLLQERRENERRRGPQGVQGRQGLKGLDGEDAVAAKPGPKGDPGADGRSGVSLLARDIVVTFWIAVGAAVVLAATVTYFATKPSDSGLDHADVDEICLEMGKLRAELPDAAPLSPEFLAVCP